MNYYEHHLGDYAEATAHLSFVEDAAYCRLMRKCYATEKPLPADIKQVQRLVGARTKEEREAVVAVLDEFWELREDGYHNARCDAEIARYQDGEPEREAKKANEENRLRRHREERAKLFKVLTDAGHHAAWNIGMPELRDLVKRITATAPETLLPPLPATAPATPATATQTPYPYTIPSTKEKDKGRASAFPPPNARPPDLPEPDITGHQPTQAGAICRAMKAAGLQSVNPGDPRLLALIEQGATEAEFVGIAAEAVEKRKGFAWVLTVLQNRRSEAAAIALAPPTAATETPYARKMREQYEVMAPSIAAQKPGALPTPITFDMEVANAPARLTE